MKKGMKNVVKITVEKTDRDALRALRQDTGKMMFFLFREAIQALKEKIER